MIKHVWSVLCQRSVVDSKTNNISMIDVFERIDVNIDVSQKNIPEEVNVPINYEIVSLWSYDTIKKNKTIYIKLDFFDPTKKVTKILDKKLILPANKIRMRDIFQIQGLPLKKTGKYFFKLFSKEKLSDEYLLRAELPLEVNIQ